MIITIDGPAGSGKSTIAKMLAEHYDFVYLNTGAIYRTIAFAAIQEGIGIEEKYKNELLNICSEVYYRLDMSLLCGKSIIIYNNMDITELIRMKEISEGSSIVSSFPFIREAVLNYQREYAKNNSIVVEGRDVGSVVFPNADIKFYLTSNLEERANRQFDEINKTRTNLKDDVYFLNIKISYEDIKNGIKERDIRDKNREVAPLIIPNNAIVIDNTELTIDETFAIFLHTIYKETGYEVY